MNDLQLGLVITGGVAVVGVLLFNLWQERKYRRQAESLIKSKAGDALLEPGSAGAGRRVEPTLGGADAARLAAGTPVASGDGVDVTGAASAPVDEPLPDLEPVPLPPAPGVDAAIDLVGVIQIATPVTGAQLPPLMARTESFAKQVLWEGLEAGEWHGIRPAGRYPELRLGLQLADRRGPLSGADIARFCQLVEQFAAELKGTPKHETPEGAAKRAVELDTFSADVDLEIGVNVVAGEGTSFPGTQVAALAQAVGLEAAPDGVFREAGAGERRFTLRNSEPRPFTPEFLANTSTRGITLLLDVPRVADGVAAFERMVAVARDMAGALGGQVVDDDRRPLTDAGVQSVQRQLAAISRQMEAFGIPAGSRRALRLFA